ncbi:hypothetical protein H6F78_01560 [Coleofasciculus sp. FACHB-64]|uniref:hypothetical protein n=1 Tax=Cyanophyceae TaxID=3028117 RepID=UPI0016827D93|nr:MULTISPECIES: hypothetical protein [unclassified Coleofasciculus]MBD1839807.1 hypothetical protein [Coleofasciculus sp. FACHB-501]MBD2044327.1 hypothetical protein [Coleofasciculus sp. FACHB-64]
MPEAIALFGELVNAVYRGSRLTQIQNPTQVGSMQKLGGCVGAEWENRLSDRDYQSAERSAERAILPQIQPHRIASPHNLSDGGTQRHRV